jgi:hypothetical protein
MASEQEMVDMKMDRASLYCEEVFTDRRIGTVRRMRPVKPDGSDDKGRNVLFVGQAQLYTPAGPLPLSFEIPAANLEEAVAGFGEAAKQAVDQTMRELEEMRRDAASSIVVPGASGAGLGGAGGVPGPGGKIQLR